MNEKFLIGWGDEDITPEHANVELAGQYYQRVATGIHSRIKCVALALEKGKVTANTIINCAPGRMTIGSATISDAHPHGALTVAQVIQGWGLSRLTRTARRSAPVWAPGVWSPTTRAESTERQVSIASQIT